MCHKQCWLRFGETFVENTFLGHSNWKSIFCFIWAFFWHRNSIACLLSLLWAAAKILLKSCYAAKQLVLSTVCIGLCHFWWIGHISRAPAVYCAVNLVFVKVFRQLIQMLERSWKAACATFRCWIEHCHFNPLLATLSFAGILPASRMEP